jgi:hypothetical protein
VNAAGGDTCRPTCRHCTDRPVTRPRGLCFRCFYVPGVKEMYPSTSKYARRGVGLGFGGKALPAVPTLYAPGTPEKLTVLEERAGDGVALWHPHDARFEGDPRPVRFMATAGLQHTLT